MGLGEVDGRSSSSELSPLRTYLRARAAVGKLRAFAGCV